MFKKLPDEVKALIVRGVYSLFELSQSNDGFDYVLIKSNTSGILLNADGSVAKPVTDVESLKIGKMLTINDVSIPESVSVQNVL